MSLISSQSPMLVRRLLEAELNSWLIRTGDPWLNSLRKMHIFIFGRL